MDEKIGRRGLLKMVAGTLAGAIGASVLAEKVAAKEPELIPMRHGQQLQTANVSAMGVYTGTATTGLANNVTMSTDGGDGVFVNGHEWGVGGGQVIPTNIAPPLDWLDLRRRNAVAYHYHLSISEAMAMSDHEIESRICVASAEPGWDLFGLK